MTGTATTRRKRALMLIAFGTIVVAGVLFGAWYLTSGRFQEYVRRRIVADLERITGGRVEMASLTWRLSRMDFEIKDLTVHGRERPTEPAYAHADRVQGRAKIISFFRRQIGLSELGIERPVIRVSVYPDGTTNVPAAAPSSNLREVGLFELAVDRMDIRDGELWLNDNVAPLEVHADEVEANIRYDLLDQRYDGDLKVGNTNLRYADFVPIASKLQAQFSLWSTHAQVKSLSWSSGRSLLNLSGEVPDFRALRVNVLYNGHFDAGEFGRILRWGSLCAGIVDLKGKGTFTASDFSAAGNLTARELEYRDSDVHVRQATIGAQYVASKETLQVPHLFAHIFGGTVIGDVQVRNWRNAAQQEGTSHLRLENIPVQSVAKAIASRELPLDRMNLAGSSGGKIDLQWSGFVRNLRASILAGVVPPTKPAPDQLPLSARLQAEYLGRGGALQVAHLALATPATRLTASGTLGRESENLRLTVATSDLREFQPIFDTLYGSRKIPVELRGQSVFSGTAIGHLKALTISGHLQATNFDTLLTVPALQSAGQGSGAHRAHWDSLSSDLLLSPKMVAARSGVLESGRAKLNFDGSISLSSGRVVPGSPISAHLVIQNGELSDLQALAGFTQPVSGTLNASFVVAGSWGDPRGGGHFGLSNATLYGEHVKTLVADAKLANRDVQFNNINLEQNGSRLTGTAGYSFSTAAFRFDVRGTNFDLARLRRLQTGRFLFGGRLDFTARGSGTRKEPMVDARVQLTNLVVNGEPVGDFTADAVTAGAEMRITGRSNFENADLRVDGNVRLRGDYDAKFKLHFTHLDFDPLIRAFKGHITGHSSSAGDFDIQGPLVRPRDLNVSGQVTELSANLENMNIRNEGPVRFSMAQELLRLEELRLVGEETSVTASGTVELSARPRLDLRSNGRVNLKLLQSYVPGLSSSGMATFALTIGGVIANPQVQGQAEIAGGAFSYRDIPNGLSDVNGTLLFNRDRLVVQSLTGRTGGGTLNVGGFVTYGRAHAFDLKVSGRDIRLRYPAGISSMANVDLALTGSLQNAALTGDIKITKFAVTPQFDLATYVARAKQPLEPPRPNSALNNLHLDVHISSTPELQVQTSLAKVSGDMDLRLRGVGSRPVLLGRVNIIEGDLTLGGTKYRLERGDVTFSNPVRIEPVLDIEATAHVKEYDVTLGFHGPMDRLATSYHSDPPLPTADIIALLALGHTREETGPQQQQNTTFSEAASYAILGQALNAAVSSRVQRIFGVNRIKIDPQAAATETGTTQSGPQLSIEQQVNNNITLTYITNLSQGNQQTVQLQYDINRNVSIIAIRDDLTGVVSFDVKIRQRKK